MQVIIYTKDPQNVEDWAVKNRGENSYFIRDMREFSPEDVEKCDEVWMTEQSKQLKSCYPNIKLFDPTAEIKQSRQRKSRTRGAKQ